MQLFCDLDGVLANLDGWYKRAFGVDPRGRSGIIRWDLVSAAGDIYKHVRPTPDCYELWDRIRVHAPIVLTGLPYSIPAHACYKHDWVRRNLGPGVPMICCQSRDKYVHATPGDVLIDDREEFRSSWELAGGVWITHRTAAETVQCLSEMGL